jgi:hypothetical protein
MWLFLVLICLACSNSDNKIKRNDQNAKIEHIRDVIKKSGFIELPLIFDANIDNSLKTKYDVDFKRDDSLIFESDIWRIVGFLPDTTDYFAFLFHTVGDMLYPTIMTIDKKGNKIDRQIICAAGCVGHTEVEVSSCYDSVWISSDLKLKSISKVTGTVETEDSIPKTINICNIRKVNGFVDKSGKIMLTESDLIDCNN